MHSILSTIKPFTVHDLAEKHVFFNDWVFGTPRKAHIHQKFISRVEPRRANASVVMSETSQLIVVEQRC